MLVAVAFKPVRVSTAGKVSTRGKGVNPWKTIRQKRSSAAPMGRFLPGTHSAPAGPRHVATGEAQRNPWRDWNSPILPQRGRGVSRFLSFEHIFLIELNAVSAKEVEEFGFELLPLVMFGLSRNVLLHGFL